VTPARTDSFPGSAGRLLAAVLAGSVLVLVGGCGSDTSRKPTSIEDKVRVSGDFAKLPKITIATPLKVPASKSWTLVKGTGETVGPQATAILHLTMADARTGKTVISTLKAGQPPLEASMTDQLFPSLVTALTGSKAGSRVVIASTAKDSYGTQGNAQLGIKAGDPVVMVADVLSADPAAVLPGPTGATTPATAKAPRLLTKGESPTGFDVNGLTKPTQVQTYVLREGAGPTLTEPRRIAADYLGVAWGKKVPFDSSYPKEPARFTIGTVASTGGAGVIPCWDKGLAGVKAGARVVLVCPPASAYGAHKQAGIPANSTLVFVIDVLGIG
jgi:peptidylprolyl isomerase